MQIGVITNPHSRKNRGRPDRVGVLQQIVGDLGQVRQTAGPESIKPVLREFLRRRARFWVSDGGDGALHWMLRMGLEVLEEDEFAGRSLPLALPTNGGTIDFVAHNVGIRGNAESILQTLGRALRSGRRIEEVEVDSMLVEGLQATGTGDQPFRTLGFASAAGGVGQRFFSKYYEARDPSPRTIVEVVAKTVASLPVTRTPLRHLPGVPAEFKSYAETLFRPTRCRVVLDGVPQQGTEWTGIHVASMSINLGNVLRFFGGGDVDGQLHVIAGAPSPLQVIRNLPRMHRGQAMVGPQVVDRPCQELSMQALGPELLAPVIDGECYHDLRRVSFRLGPRVRIPKVVGHVN
jgi:hypothetical protein